MGGEHESLTWVSPFYPAVPRAMFLCKNNEPPCLGRVQPPSGRTGESETTSYVTTVNHLPTTV